MKEIGFIVAFILMFWSCFEVQAKDNNQTICTTDTSRTEAITIPDKEVKKIKKFVKTVWFKMPSKTNKIETVTKYLTDSFNTPITKTLEKLNKSTDEVDQWILAEAILCWWGAQDPDPKGTLKNISIVSASENEAVVIVEYLNYTSPETHTLILKKVNGKWLLDNFDNQKQYIWDNLNNIP